tara:strand:- start:1255 stop:1458 length:204 start_codon:yes stop_codon:yes gene_type:complete
MKIFLKKLFGLKFAVKIVNPNNISFDYSKVESICPPKMDKLSYKEALKVCKELEGPLFDMKLNVKIL